MIEAMGATRTTEGNWSDLWTIRTKGMPICCCKCGNILVAG